MLPDPPSGLHLTTTELTGITDHAHLSFTIRLFAWFLAF